MTARLLSVSRCDPFEQMPVRDVAAIKNANNRVAHQACLVTDENECEHELRCVGAKVTPDAPKMAGPRNSARMSHQTSRHVEISRERHRQQDKKAPQKWRARKDRPRCQQP